MNKLKNLFLIVSVFFAISCKGQENGEVSEDSITKIDTSDVEVLPENKLQNAEVLKPFFEKIIKLQKEKKGKINIVHIGDSHIQADLMTNFVRKKLQEEFGNGGRGFIFPHSLAKTNGSSNERFKSNRNWESYRNIYSDKGNPVGLSGIALWTNAKDFAVEINTRDSSYDFTTIKVFTPKNKKQFDFALSERTIVLESQVPKKITHRIKRGEAISIIADKYNVSIAELKRANNLRSNNIQAGKTLKIPTGEMQPKSVTRSEFIPLEMKSDAFSHIYKSEKPLDKIYLIPDTKSSDFELNGLFLENENPGIVYSSIGVNGAKFSDYNKYPLFFEQLAGLQPDLIILSLGTNESFDKMASADFMLQLELFLEMTRKKTQSPVLVSTPPSSLFKRKFPNTFAADYAESISAKAIEKKYSVFDLYSQLGGLYGVERNAARGFMASDKVHYSKAGYERQGKILAQAILREFDNYKNGIK